MTEKEKPSKETLKEWSNNPSNWKWEMFYYNKEDKRIFPPKRIPWMGWTVNFANTKSVIVFIVILAIAIGLIIFFPNH
ncbi:MAG: DUF5808 domain-containing protein [Flavobacterium sp.]